MARPLRIEYEGAFYHVFSRGNKKSVGIIREYLAKHELEGELVFRGAHCFNQCEHGPLVRIGEKEFRGIGPDEIERVLDKELLSLSD